MGKDRMAAFSDGVIAILITIMVLELNPPEDATLESLRPLAPVFISYVLSFLFLGIYWTNHHHLLVVVDQVDGRTLWANLHLLFWLSLIPFGTHWLGLTSFASLPVALYGADLLLAAGLTSSWSDRSSRATVTLLFWRPRSAATSRARLRSWSTPSRSRWRSPLRGSPMVSTPPSRCGGSCPIAASRRRS